MQLELLDATGASSVESSEPRPPSTVLTLTSFLPPLATVLSGVAVAKAKAKDRKGSSESDGKPAPPPPPPPARSSDFRVNNLRLTGSARPPTPTAARLLGSSLGLRSHGSKSKMGQQAGQSHASRSRARRWQLTLLKHRLVETELVETELVVGTTRDRAPALNDSSPEGAVGLQGSRYE